MTALQAQALLPFFVLAGGIVLVLMLVAWLRSEVVAFGATLAVLAASALTVPWAADAGAQTVDGLLTVDRFALFFFALFAATAIVMFSLLNHLPWKKGTEGHEPQSD